MIVFVSGSYDILNAGHIMSFRDLKLTFHDSFLLVGLNTDELMMKHKGRVIIPYKQRKIILLALKDVDLVVPCDTEKHLELVKRYDVDVYATVTEWIERQKETIDWIEKNGGSVFKLKYYPEDGEILSSSQIRRRVIEAGK